MPLKRKRKAAAAPGAEEVVQTPEPAAAAPGGKRRKAKAADAAPAPAAAAAPAKAPKKRRKAAADAPAPPPAAEPPSAEPAAARNRGGKRQQKRKAAAAAAAAAAEAAEAARPRKKKKKAKADASADGAEASAADAAPAEDGREALPEEPRYCVFVDGVPYNWEVEKIRQLFGRCGPVVEVRAPTWQDSGRLRGYAHVDYSTPEGRDEALKMDGIKVAAKGRFLKVESAKSPGAPSKATTSTKDLVGKRRLFVKNIPYDAVEAELKDVFTKFGPVRDIRVPTSFGRCKGFAYIEFGKPDALAQAVKMGAELRGRKLVLDADTGSGPKAGFHYRPTAFEVAEAASGRGRGRGHGPGSEGRSGRGRGRGP